MITSSRTHPLRGTVSSQPALVWKDGMLCGNGTLGVCVMGTPHAERIQLSRSGLYMPLHQPLTPVDQGRILPELRDMLVARRYQDAADRVVTLSHEEGWGEKRWTDPFVPAFDLTVRHHSPGSVTRYERCTDFATAEVLVRWAEAGYTVRRRCFASRTQDVFVLELTTDDPAGLHLDLAFDNRLRDTTEDWNAPATFESGVAATRFHASDNTLTAVLEFKRQWPGSLRGAVAAATLHLDGGSVECAGPTARITGARRVLVLTAVDLWPAGSAAEALLPSLATRLRRLAPDYDALLSPSAAAHAAIFLRSRLELAIPADPLRNATSEQLLAEIDRTGHAPPVLIERQYDAARYAILCSSGDMPPNLQGIWAGTWAPPWSGDYTQNGNLQTAIAANEIAAMPECMEGYFAYLESQLPHYRENARRMFACRGINVPSRTSTHGLNNHFDGTWPMTFWTAGAAWAAHFFYDHYRFSGDFDFLRDRAFPFMLESAEFYEDFLTPSPAGTLGFSPSYSPENHPGNSPSQSCVDAAMDLGAARQLLRNCIEASNLLSRPQAERNRWQALLDRLPSYRINDDACIAEWLAPDLDDNHRHRHASHLYELYYGLPTDIAQNPTLLSAFQKTVQRRIEFRREEPTGEMAFGLVQMAQAAVSLRQPALCQEILGWLTTWYWTRSLATTHNRGEVFNVDICGGIPDVIARALLDSSPGRILLLPGLPPAWSLGRIEGVRCRGQILAQSLEWSPSHLALTLSSPVAQRLTLEFCEPLAKFKINGIDQPISPSSSRVEIDLLPHHPVTFHAERRPVDPSPA